MAAVDRGIITLLADRQERRPPSWRIDQVPEYRLTQRFLSLEWRACCMLTGTTIRSRG
jgi:hypothetical protein